MPDLTMLSGYPSDHIIEMAFLKSLNEMASSQHPGFAGPGPTQTRPGALRDRLGDRRL